MAVRIAPSIELKRLTARGLLDLEDITASSLVYCALARTTFKPDQGQYVRLNNDSRSGFSLLRPSAANKHVYEAENSGTTGGSPPVFPTDGGTVTDGDIILRDIGIAAAPPFIQTPEDDRVGMPSQVITQWAPSTAYSIGDFVYPTVGSGLRNRFAIATVAGTSDSVEPVWPSAGSTIVDSGVTWRVVAGVGDHPFPSELEILDDGATIGYTVGGLVLGSQSITQIGRSVILEGDDVNFTTATVTAGWGILYANTTILDDDDGGTWHYPILGYVLLTDDRSELGSVAADFIVNFPTDGILRLR